MLNKIISYESTGPDLKPWYNRMILIGGKTFGLVGGVPDGEYVCEIALDYMVDGGIIDPNEVTRIYVSNNYSDSGGLRPMPDDIATGITHGGGFMDMQGHGNPYRWDTIWADGEYEDHAWSGGTFLFDFWRFFNMRKLPAIIVGGCHNGMFNVTLLRTAIDPPDAYWTHGQPTPICFSYGFLVVPWGGGISSTGNTGLGIGFVGDPTSLSAYLETSFFYEIGVDGAETLGQAHSGAVARYMTDYRGTQDQVDLHVITIFQVFGDPSLKFGGYPII
jgi:hypothetical protein